MLGLVSPVTVWWRWPHLGLSACPEHELAFFSFGFDEARCVIWLSHTMGIIIMYIGIFRDIKAIAVTSQGVGSLAGEYCYNKCSYMLRLCCCWFSHRYICNMHERVFIMSSYDAMLVQSSLVGTINIYLHYKVQLLLDMSFESDYLHVCTWMSN